ncbi:linear amide C-N hydrolase [Levilactobacillus humaensis]|uniref:linear amide C-N hydrolase n=1 Tax=Levilactobacillus humaensis TaxID=2950375 RepID=UPI0021C28197|nr:linear amide C-N hydrolase [Levilactobacillus humaensis]
MCTSLTYTTASAHHFFARTMDFPTTTPWRPVFLPRQHHWQPAVGPIRTSQYAILGGGRRASDWHAYLLGDGVNEAGLSCAELYLPGAATYADQPAVGQVNLGPQDFITWVLGEHTTLAEVIADLPRVTLLNRRWGQATAVYPFHWILSDPTGQTIVIEPTGGPLQAQVNPAGILTNTPILATHLKNLNRYLGVAGDNFTSETIQAAKIVIASGQKLPAKTIPTDRFIHMAIRRWGTPIAENDEASTREIFQWLAEVSLPFDPKRQGQPNHNYTHYRSIFNLEAKMLTFQSRRSRRLQQIVLTPEMASHRHFPHAYPAE